MSYNEYILTSSMKKINPRLQMRILLHLCTIQKFEVSKILFYYFYY